MKATEFKNKVIKKFETVSRFCRIAGIDRYEMQKLLLSAERFPDEDKDAEIGKYAVLIDKFENVDPNDFTEALRKKLLYAIRRDFDTVKNFVKQNEDFTEHIVYQVLAGKRKKITKKTALMMKILGVTK